MLNFRSDRFIHTNFLLGLIFLGKITTHFSYTLCVSIFGPFLTWQNPLSKVGESKDIDNELTQQRNCFHPLRLKVFLVES